MEPRRSANVMNVSRWIQAIVAVGLALFGTSAEAALGRKKGQDEPPPVFYPAPPETPRIQFLRKFSSEKDVRRETSGFRRFVLGDEEKEELVVKPYGVAFHNGKIFVCDTAQSHVAVLDLKENSFGYLGRSVTGGLKKPINITVDADGTRYVADTGHKRVMVYDADNDFVRAFGDPEKMGPVDVAVFNEILYVCDIDNGQVVALDKRTGEERRRFGKKGSGEGELFFPTNLALDVDGNVFVSDTGNARVLKFDARGNFVQQFGEIGMSPGQFARPKGIAVDRESRLYVVDAAFENVQIFDRDGKLLLFFGLAGNIPGGMNLPAKITIDYDNVGLLADRVAPGHEVEYLILVTNQYGLNKINVYGFLKTQE